MLAALARALGLDAAERGHLATLAGSRDDTTPEARVSPLLQQIMNAMAHCPAFATDHRLDVMAWNGLGAELMGGLADPGRRDHNQARYLFLDPAARFVFPEWEARATESVGQLRVAAGRYRQVQPGVRSLRGQHQDPQRPGHLAGVLDASKP